MIQTKIKRKLMVALVLICSMYTQAQSVYIDFTDGTEMTFGLQDVKKVTFEGDVMQLILNDETLFSWNVSTIGRYTYDELPVSVGAISSDTDAFGMKLYPNPSKNDFTVRYYIQHDSSVSIVLTNMNGETWTIVSEKFHNKGEHTIQVTNLSLKAGIYMCQVTGADFSIAKQLVIQ